MDHPSQRSNLQPLMQRAFNACMQENGAKVYCCTTFPTLRLGWTKLCGYNIWGTMHDKALLCLTPNAQLIPRKQECQNVSYSSKYELFSKI